MSIKITIPNSSSDVLTFGSGNTPTAAQIAGIDSGSSNGQLALYTTASGTSTERVRVDASGNVGIGTSSPVGRLGVVSTGGNSRLSIGDTAASTYSTMLMYGGSGKYNFQLGVQNNVNNAFEITPSTAAGGTTFSTPAMVIDSSGNLLVGTTSTVGTSAAGSVHIVGGPNNNNTGPLFLRNSFATAGKYWKVGPVNDNGYIVFNQNGTGVYISDGATSWTSNSDERNKDIIEPIINAAEKVCTLRSVIGKYKTDAEGTRRAFLIAQDVQAVLPEAVNAQNDERGTLGVAYTDIIPLLVAAIKEQQAIITSLTDRITALENK